jgi:hypothetical protein
MAICSPLYGILPSLILLSYMKHTLTIAAWSSFFEKSRSFPRRVEAILAGFGRSSPMNDPSSLAVALIRFCNLPPSRGEESANSVRISCGRIRTRGASRGQPRFFKVSAQIDLIVRTSRPAGQTQSGLS